MVFLQEIKYLIMLSEKFNKKLKYLHLLKYNYIYLNKLPELYVKKKSTLVLIYKLNIKC